MRKLIAFLSRRRLQPAEAAGHKLPDKPKLSAATRIRLMEHALSTLNSRQGITRS